MQDRQKEEVYTINDLSVLSIQEGIRKRLNTTDENITVAGYRIPKKGDFLIIWIPAEMKEQAVAIKKQLGKEGVCAKRGVIRSGFEFYSIELAAHGKGFANLLQYIKPEKRIGDYLREAFDAVVDFFIEHPWVYGLLVGLVVVGGIVATCATCGAYAPWLGLSLGTMLAIGGGTVGGTVGVFAAIVAGVTGLFQLIGEGCKSCLPKKGDDIKEMRSGIRRPEMLIPQNNNNNNNNNNRLTHPKTGKTVIHTSVSSSHSPSQFNTVNRPVFLAGSNRQLNIIRQSPDETGFKQPGYFGK